MQNSWKRLTVVATVAVAMSVMGAARSTARADDHKSNACGCYQKIDGTCVCGRPSKCGCPEECEPKGCAEKRQKEIDKEIQSETKKAQEADKKRSEDAAAAAKAKAEAEARATDTDEFENVGAAEEEAPVAADKVKKSKDKKDKKDKKDTKDTKDTKEAK
jgi:hypothetical protein